MSRSPFHEATDPLPPPEVAGSSSLLARAMERSPDGLLITDAHQRIIATNPAMCSICGYANAELLGQTPRLFRSGHHDAGFYGQLWQSLRDTGHWRGELVNRHKDGAIHPQLVGITAVPDAQGSIGHYFAQYMDSGFLGRYQAQLQYQASHDMLTGLANRSLFLEQLRAALGRARRNGAQVGVLFMDLDRFKLVNDSLGHDAGDALLQAVSRRLQEQVREVDTVARFGGDEFAVLLDAIGDSQAAIVVARKLIASFDRPVQLGSREVRTSLSIGISCFPQDGGDAEELLRHADAAMYRAKNESRGSYQFYSEQMNLRALENLVMGSALRLALQRGELLLHYQPQYHLASGHPHAVEALLRWQHPELGLIAPARFLPLAEESGLIEPVGEWVLEAACRQMRRWLDAGTPVQRITVNLSPRQLRDPQLPTRILHILHRNGLQARHVALEFPETLFLPDPAEASDRLERLRACGVGIVIDDFGTGWSSLSRLRHLPVDQIKIDRSVVHGTPDDIDNAAVVSAIIGMAGPLGVSLVAEGIETNAQIDFLRQAGCTFGQGFLLGAPQAADQLPGSLEQRLPL